MKKSILKNTNDRLKWAMAATKEEILSTLNTSFEGYDQNLVLDMREKFGRNSITEQKKVSTFKKFIEAFVNPFTIILFILAFVSFVTDISLAEPGEKEFTGVIIISTMVLVSGLLRFIQEKRSSNAVEKLNEMVETTASIKRYKNEKKEIPVDEIVVGDIIYFTAGDIVPADIRIVQAKDLFISQSSLTGESDAVEKFSFENTSDLSILESSNLVFMGSNVISGSAIGVVIAVGDDTILGGIAKQLNNKKVITSFDKGVNSVSKVLITFMIFMVPFIFMINGLIKGDWFEAFLFALSIAVGLTPEMLPMIVSANLAKGAAKMAKKKVIVKNLNSIQDFGAIDVLCTDKTGTLTEDKIVLEHYLDIEGNEDKRVLRHAFLNSFYQTGLKNLIDIAIINHSQEEDLKSLSKDYTKIDEIPFDFSRRRMSVLIEDLKGKTQLITKGAIEEMISVSTFVEYKGNIEPLTDEIKKEILEKVRSYNSKGLRILGVSQKNIKKKECSIADEAEMVLIGYLAFLDPPKQSTKKAIETLLEYNVNVKILTGDNDIVTSCICNQVGLDSNNIILGSDIEKMSFEELKIIVEKVNIFAKLSPNQKTMIVKTLRENGHIVGFMGDGINDAPAMKEADVGISVDGAVDIAKESADIILLEKDLMVLEEGIIEGRKIYGNIIKYIKMTASSNFGNMFSVLVASAFLPFLPMYPIQILMLNLIYDLSCIGIPWDNVDEEFLKIPRKWDASSIKKFMISIGPSSSVFDITTFGVMYFIICPMVFGGSFNTLNESQQVGFIALFNAGWFVESLWSQTLVIHMIRTPKIPFIQSRASWTLSILTTLGILVGTIIPFTSLGTNLGMMALPFVYFPFLAITIFLYIVLVTLLKKWFIKRHGELL
ncbi:magnesium-translocating P-type ATPase [Cetobacterium sp. 8H]|uniref:magnesium-translocating P-type ATPase n=1 Tax=Cetobacterium sp. 8H TaxID=2759681 RepID=UPI00163D12D0|nr:magnesium-translocating P-type ATPase [Cetobacterium sp. 8H]MBC2850194.1 magnesium-translocating P-type ATPase [Cetobacterium sp. 8H]